MRSMKKVLFMLQVLMMSLVSIANAQVAVDLNFSLLSNFPLWSPQEKSRIHLKNVDKATAIVLLSPECPMCINYTTLLKQINKKYGQQVNLVGVVPGKTYSDSTILEFAGSYNIDFPLYTDSTMQLCRFLKGEVTPQVFLFERNGRLVFHGALDNWLSGLGKKRNKPDEHYLLDAINQTLNGATVTRAYVKPQGCLLNEF